MIAKTQNLAHLAPRLVTSLRTTPDLAVAVSGGVDSLTLATFVGRLRAGPGQRVFHAVSPAVPPEATERVKRRADLEGWNLEILDAGEFADPDYLRNPVNRCYFCKSNLYGRIASISRQPIAAGTNTDDLGDYRPGLEAARRHGVLHPFVDAGIDKVGVRALSRDLGLDDVADLPAAPCLASRIETGLRVEPALLTAVNEVERLVRDELGAGTVRCRIRAEQIVVELGEGSPAQVPEHVRSTVVSVLARHGLTKPLAFAPYKRGSAFVGHV